MSKIEYQCSNCGKWEKTGTMVGVPEGMYTLGYRAVGDAIYCPDCVKTWAERNGKPFDEQFSDPPHLFAIWWNRQVRRQCSGKPIKAYKNTGGWLHECNAEDAPI